MDPIEKFLHDEWGLSLDSIGRERTLQKVAELMAAEALADEAEYVEALGKSESHRRKLLDVITVPESWFFRDGAPYEFLARWASGWQRGEDNLPLSVLSLPCATGEEPYSIAITLLQAGLKPGDFRVQAVDINPRLLERARAGLFGLHSFRGVKVEDFAAYFHPLPGGEMREVTPRVKDQVEFREGNLFRLDAVFGSMKFDAIFCRNLLIYFSAESQARALLQLQERLKPHGVVFLGHSEAGKAALDLFQPCGSTAAFAFTKRAEGAGPSELAFEALSKGARSSARGAGARTGVPASKRKAKKSSAMAPANLSRAQEKVFTELQSLADSGNLAKAVQQCEYILDYAEDDARLLYLCGVVNEACGRHEKACLLYRRALEVDPKQRDVMVHLAVTLETHGEVAEAQRLKKAADQLEFEADEENDGG